MASHFRRICISLLVVSLLSNDVLALRCYVGLGNSSARHRQKVHTCPDEEGYVCIKMFGGGMGDRIRRKCDKIEPDAYAELLAQEQQKAEAEATGEPLESDPACKETTHNGRDVILCLCSTEKCNNQDKLRSSTYLITFVLALMLLHLT